MVEIDKPRSNIVYAEEKLKKASIRISLVSSKFGFERKRILIGYIGERIVMDFLKISKDSDNYDYDLISKKGNKIEVKTISCKSKPKMNYLCTVNSHDSNSMHKQKADVYIFTRILNDYSKGWILGWITCDYFFKKGKFIKKGTSFGNFKFIRTNATVLPINELNPLTK